MSIPTVMIIAGSDSGGGAGIQADIKAVAALGGHAATVITALTAQNTIGVHGVHPVPLDFVRAQFDAVAGDIGAQAVKTGMLHSSELVKLVAELVAGLEAPVVVDPVMVAKGGDRLLARDAVEAVRTLLLPRAALVTPNLDEAEALLGYAVADRAAMGRAARDLVKMGARAALVKGGHLAGEPGDLFFDGADEYFLSAPRLDTPHTHGTGCTLASALAALIARGEAPLAAVKRARLLVRRAIAGALPLGQGHGPVHAMADLAPRLALPRCMAELSEAVHRLEAADGLGRLVPEVRCQLAYAPPGADDPNQVPAVAGRITAVAGRMRAAGPVMPGASRHVAGIVLTAMMKDPARRTAMALRFSEKTIARARSLGWRVGEFSRADEPREVKEAEGSTLEWGTARVIEDMGLVPDLIFDRGEDGKEPVMRLLAETPAQAVEMVMQLAGQEDS